DDRLALAIPRLRPCERRARVAASLRRQRARRAMADPEPPGDDRDLHPRLLGSDEGAPAGYRRPLRLHDLRVQRAPRLDDVRRDSRALADDVPREREPAEEVELSAQLRSRDRRIERARELRHCLFGLLSTPRAVWAVAGGRRSRRRGSAAAARISGPCRRGLP